MKMHVLVIKAVIVSVTGIFFTSTVFANLEQVKIYKAAFPDEEKPKCIACHIDKIPKKDDGKHDWNEYGLKVRKIKEKPDEETYKAAGKNRVADAE